MKHWLWIILYVLIQDGGLTYKSTYEGMTQPEVDSLLKDRQKDHPGSTYSFVSQKTFVSTPDPWPPLPTGAADPVRTQAISDAKNIGKTPQERLDALIKAIDLK